MKVWDKGLMLRGCLVTICAIRVDGPGARSQNEEDDLFRHSVDGLD